MSIFSKPPALTSEIEKEGRFEKAITYELVQLQGVLACVLVVAARKANKYKPTSTKKEPDRVNF